MPDAKALKGFSNVSYFPVTANTTAAYTATPKTALGAGARSCVKEDTKNEFKIPGDNGIYLQGSDYESTKLTIQVNEMSLADLAALIGAIYDDTPYAAGPPEVPAGAKELIEGELDNAPQVALSFAGLLTDGSHRMYKYLSATLTSYKADLKARLDTGNDVNGYTLEFLCVGRAADGRVRITKDSGAPDAGTGAVDLTWLDTIPAVS